MYKVITTSIIISVLFGCSSVPSAGLSEQGQASFYADKYQGRLTASGESFSQKAFSAAHKTWSFGTKVRVTNLANNKTVIVTINDRGPFVRGRVIDLSKQAFIEIADLNDGLIDVRITTITSP
ncbi:septal ring lytic transglycosylase RlpA family protein [Pseudoalteromonas shioyasakiensis]|uniref:septal ring lytic transglycosylase RlpA family protein n=1 Tax=Pseudoalteromonas shioyasakiensis TaxID=1190813 RepID=UPI002741421E|nr:septal ring lytic transglycosylase RlpA family protein [Pseudoalteromonas shioyasakiensis]